ncbi:MAG TPA: hypothetical protein VIB79_30185 [Candidatus Binatia bacterium]
MRSILAVLVVLFVVLPAVFLGALFLAVDNHPAIDRAAEITPQNIERARKLLEQNDPRKLRPGDRRTVKIGQRDADVAANYLMQRYARGSARVTLDGSAAQIAASAELPKNPIGRFINADAVVTGSGSLPRIERLRIGGLSLPGFVAEWLLTKAMLRCLGEENYQALQDAITRVDFRDGAVSVTYHWRSDLPDRVRTTLISPADQERVRLYNERLVDAARSIRSENAILAEVLIPIFSLAAEQSVRSDPAAENRAAILTLTLYILREPITTLIPPAKDWPRPVQHTVTLNRRDDFAKHFIVSAALSANAGTPLADAVGVYKEIADSRGGSGFSFNDIAADRAGTRFGEEATRSAEAARALQQRIASGVREREIMPRTDDLPEFMPEPEFLRRFGGVDAPAYKQMMAKIERRISELAFYR